MKNNNCLCSTSVYDTVMHLLIFFLYIIIVLIIIKKFYIVTMLIIFRLNRLCNS